MIPKQERLVEIWRLTNEEKIQVITVHINLLRKKIIENTKFAALKIPEKIEISEYSPEEIKNIIPEYTLSRINYLSDSPSFEYMVDYIIPKYKFVSTSTITSGSFMLNDPKNIILYLIEKLDDNRWSFRFANISDMSDVFLQERRELKIKEIIE
jgi:hypothetical protein